MPRINRIFPGWVKESEGVAAIETIIVLIPLLLFVFGMVDLGHAWFLRQAITNASREGARYGVVNYTTKKTVDEIKTEVANRLSYAINDTDVATIKNGITVTGAGGATGSTLTVSVTYTKKWWVLNFIPTIGSEVELWVQTTMRNE